MKMRSLLCGAVLALAGPAAAAEVPTQAAMGSQLGDPEAQVRWDGHGHFRSAHGNLGVVASGPLGVEAYLRERAAPLGLRADEKLIVLADERDARGNRHVKVGRQLFGLAVAFDQLRIHARPTGAVYALEGELSNLGGLRYRSPAVLPARAETIARDGYPGKLSSPSRPTLVVFGDSLAGTTGAHLAYRVRVSYKRSGGRLPVVEDVYVDAQDGTRLHRLSMLFTAGTPTTMTSTDLTGASVTLQVSQYADGVALKDLVTLQNNGTVYTLDGSAQNNVYSTANTSTPFSDSEAASVSLNVKKSLDFFNSTFGWTRWDFSSSPAGNGGLLAGIAHVGSQLNNAYFTTADSNGQTIGTMNFGDGDGNLFTPLAKALDVATHEIGHGVVQGTAGLVYELQSGALNEHFADVFGWLNDQGNDTIGESVVGPALQPALRDMCHPENGAQGGQPANMGQYQQLANDDDHDHGGVHTNSGIPNHAACLTRNGINGGSGGGGAGAAAVGRIWFQTLSKHLGASSTFQDMVDGTVTSCTELGEPAANCSALHDAWTQVGLAPTIGAGGNCPPNSHPASQGGCDCDSGYQPNSAGTGCEAVQSASCPAHSHDEGGSCYCDSGYVPDPLGNCVIDSGNAACIPHSHSEGGTCVCDPCYQGIPTGDRPGCDPIPGCVACTDPLQTSQNGSCQCEAGTQPNSAGGCDPVPGNCGDENWTGRCEGQVLVYCDNQTNPSSPVITTDNCADTTQYPNSACALDANGGGYDCVPRQSNCGSVPETGQCNGNQAQICESGVLSSFDCGSAGCGPVTYDGVTYQFCLDDSGGTSGTTGSGGTTGGTTGHIGTSGSGATSGTSGTTGSSSGKSGGCSVAGAGGVVGLFWLVFPALRRRRR